MEKATIQKLCIDTFFCGTTVVKLIYYLRFEFTIDFINQGLSCRMLSNTFLDAKSQQL